jgi:TPM domain
VNPVQTEPSLFKRYWRHLWMSPWRLHRQFPESVLAAITDSVRRSEQVHGGEIRVAIEGDLSLRALWQRVTPRQRALEVFAALGVWDTEQRNGVLIYLCLADKDVEVVADRGLAGVSAEEWGAVCAQLERAAEAAAYQEALCEAVQSVGQLIGRHYPQADRNQQPDRPVLF